MIGGGSPTGGGMQSKTGKDFYKQKKPKGFDVASMQNFSPEMMELFQSLFSHAGEGSFLSRLAKGDQSMFEEMEAPAHRQFASKMGNMASRFGGQGLGGLSSSGFQQAGSQASSDFAQQLQSNRLGLQRQAVGDLKDFAGMLLGQRPMEKALVEKQKPWWQEAATGAATGFGQGVGEALPAFFGL